MEGRWTAVYPGVVFASLVCTKYGIVLLCPAITVENIYRRLVAFVVNVFSILSIGITLDNAKFCWMRTLHETIEIIPGMS